ncbi:MAG: DUF1002 domain-containing protein [Lachnospiraceae bacterium]|jgi:uncharacterized protein YpuA (DUF1002 family)|nr:DUF1002 domain-containing protein [Lachnospiraceae bacterium]
MKFNFIKKLIPAVLSAAMIVTMVPLTAKADSSNVVTLGSDLTSSQKDKMYEYFGTSKDDVVTISVTNSDERKYMEGIASEAEIGTKTLSCSYLQPTTSGGIQVKVANLTFVTSQMIASSLLTSGVKNCNVVAACPMSVSGTGALTGIMMAYEKASGTTLNEGQKQAATDELVTTGKLANDIGQKKATDIINDAKQEVIDDKLKDSKDISEAVSDAAEDAGVNLTDEQKQQITELMEKISQYDYDTKALNQTLKNLEGKGATLWQKIKGFFTGNDVGGIINDTKDSVLGSDVVSNNTIEGIKEKASQAINSDKGKSFIQKIKDFFANL